MSVNFFFFFLAVSSVITYCFSFTKWSRNIFLINNILIFLFTLYFWVLYNKLIINLQFVSVYNLKILNIDWILIFGINSMSLFFLILTTFLITICLFVNFEKLYKISNLNGLLWILQIVLILFFTTSDLIIFFICFEASLVPIFLIILVWGSSVRRVLAGYYFFLYTSLGAVLIILGICLIILDAGSSNFMVLEQLKFSEPKQIILFFLFFWGFAIKIPMFPFYLWLPEAHVEAPTEGSVLLAGLLLKLGGYGFIKIILNFFPLACIYYIPVICSFCIFSILIPSLNAIIQADFKKLIAYTSVSHMNFVVLGIFSHNIFGLAGSLLLMYAHGLVSSGLFIVVGLIYERYFSRQLEYYSGLIAGMPLLGTLFFFILLGNFGFPLTFNFVGELLILVGLAHFNLLILFLSGIGLFQSVIYSILLYNKLMFGNIKIFIKKIKDATLFEFNSLFSLAFMSIFFGIWPMSILDAVYLILSYCLLK